MRRRRGVVVYKETRAKNDSWKVLIQEKKSFRRRLFSQCVSRKSSTTIIDLTILNTSQRAKCSVYRDECLRRHFSSYFLPPLVATAADLVTLPDDAAFFSTSLMTPTATV
jgi:hypothetical protein